MAISPKKIYKWPIAHEKMLNIISYKGNENINHNEMPPHMHGDDCYFKKVVTENNKCWWGCQEIGTLCTVGRNVKWCLAMENSMVILQKVENRITVCYRLNGVCPTPTSYVEALTPQVMVFRDGKWHLAGG